MNKQDYKEQMGSLLNENSKLKKQVLELTTAIAGLKDEIEHLGGYAETDGYEVGSPSDYEEDKQLNIFESPDGGKTVYKRKSGDTDRRRVK